MLDVQPLNESALAREALLRLSSEKSILHRAAKVLELVAHSSVGLGEVLQDYAQQASIQVRDLIRAADNAAHGTVQPGDGDVLGGVHFVLKTIKSVLEMTPAAMQRNKSDTLGDKEKLSRADVSEIAHAFLESSDISRLLAAEDSGAPFARLAAESARGASAPAGQDKRAYASASH